MLAQGDDFGHWIRVMVPKSRCGETNEKRERAKRFREFHKEKKSACTESYLTGRSAQRLPLLFRRAGRPMRWRKTRADYAKQRARFAAQRRQFAPTLIAQ